MSYVLGRKFTVNVLIALSIAVLSTMLVAQEVGGAEEPLSTMPVASERVLPKPQLLAYPHTVVSPIVKVTLPDLPQAQSMQASIITKERVVADIQAIQREGTSGAVIDFAMAQIGDPYVWGGNGPNGWDCSGLMVGAFRVVGVNLPRTSRAQWSVGVSVAYGQWQPGDLLFYGSSASSIHHVALYIGNGQLVHASTFGVPVKTAEAPNGGGSDYLGAKRVL